MDRQPTLFDVASPLRQSPDGSPPACRDDPSATYDTKCALPRPANTEELYQQRLKRYVTAMRNEKPDRILIRPFVAEFTAKYAGFTCQEVAHDYAKAFDAAVKCSKDFDWDAVVPNMVYVWTGLAQAVGLRYCGIPGIGIPHTTGFNYIEPSEGQA
jgi:hypothetical protein